MNIANAFGYAIMIFCMYCIFLAYQDKEFGTHKLNDFLGVKYLLDLIRRAKHFFNSVDEKKIQENDTKLREDMALQESYQVYVFEGVTDDNEYPYLYRNVVNGKDLRSNVKPMNDDKEYRYRRSEIAETFGSMVDTLREMNVH